MFYDEKRLQLTRSPEDYEAYDASLSQEQKTALSRLGNENSKWLLEEYVRRLKEENDPVIYITDFMTWRDKVMIVYDCNLYYEKLEKEINNLLK